MISNFRNRRTGPRRLPPLLRRAWFGLNQAFRQRTGRMGITPDQYTVLRILQTDESDQLSQRALAERMSSDQNTVASLLRRMEALGLVARLVRLEDRRKRRLVLTPAGRRKQTQVRRAALTLQARVMAVLPKAERASFLEQLERLADACWMVARLKGNFNASK
jgi:DNA-binding MarR family transcriptional regulator